MEARSWEGGATERVPTADGLMRASEVARARSRIARDDVMWCGVRRRRETRRFARRERARSRHDGPDRLVCLPVSFETRLEKGEGLRSKQNGHTNAHAHRSSSSCRSTSPMICPMLCSALRSSSVLSNVFFVSRTSSRSRRTCC
jgi:hypothetical protein